MLSDVVVKAAVDSNRESLKLFVSPISRYTNEDVRIQATKPQVIPNKASDLLSFTSARYSDINEKKIVIRVPKISNSDVSSPFPVKSIRPEVIARNPTTDTPPTIPRHIATKLGEITRLLFFKSSALKDEERITRKELLVCRLILV
jgi:hypothetical protein